MSQETPRPLQSQNSTVKQLNASSRRSNFSERQILSRRSLSLRAEDTKKFALFCQEVENAYARDVDSQEGTSD